MEIARRTETKRGNKGSKVKASLRRQANKEPKVIENIKTAIFVKGSKSSQDVNDAMHDLHALKKPYSIQYNKTGTNQVHPFDDTTTLEFLSLKSDASLFVVGSHSKKRPANLVMGRMFEHHLMDMVELGFQNYVPIEHFKIETSAIGHKPCFLFNGEEWQSNEDYKKLANLIVDFFRGAIVTNINLMGLEHVVVCTAVEGYIFFRVYRINLKKSGSKIPRVELEEMGPSLDLTLRRARHASSDLLKASLQVPKELHAKKVKNISKNTFGVRGRIHPGGQAFNTIATKKVRAFKKRRTEKADA